MIWKLREALAERSLRKLKKDWENNGLSNIVNSKKALILVSFNDLQSFKSKKVQSLLRDISPHLEIQLVSYKKKKRKAEEDTSAENCLVLSLKDLKFGLEPKNIQAFNADILLDFTNKPETPLLFILLNSTVKMRIGNRKDWNEKYLDFMIQTDSNKGFVYLTEQLVTYLKKINTNNNAR